MGKKIIFCCIVFVSITACNAEKVNLSPVSDYDSSEKYKNTSFTDRADQINYASEITNLISTFPKFRNDAVNTETAQLKDFLKDYIGSIENYDFRNMEKAHEKYQKSYKKLQKLKVYLNLDEAEVLNRYLVRIKTNMNILETQQKKETITIND